MTPPSHCTVCGLPIAECGLLYVHRRKAETASRSALVHRRANTQPPVQLPTCATCNRPVDRLTSERDPLCCWTTFAAECHGEREEVRLTDKQLAEATRLPDGRLFAIGTAFRGES